MFQRMRQGWELTKKSWGVVRSNPGLRSDGHNVFLYHHRSGHPATGMDVDFGVEIKGTTLADGAYAKQAPVTFSNHGTTKPSEVRIKVSADADLRGNAEVDLYGNASPRPCELDEQGRADCLLDKSLIPAPGGSVDLNAYIRKIGSASA